MTRLSKWILFFISYIPLFAIFALDCVFNYIKNNGFIFTDGLVHFFTNPYSDYYVYTFWVLIAVILFLLIFFAFIIKVLAGQKIKVTIVNIKKNESDVSSYFITYLIPFLGANDSVFDLIIFACVFILIGFIYVENNMLHVNPTLFLLRYKVFNATLSTGEEVCLICKKSPISIRRDPNIVVSKLSESFFIEISS